MSDLSAAGITLRPARPVDVEIAAELIFATTQPFGDELIGLGDHTLALRAICAFYLHPGTRMSWQFTHLAEIDGQVAGLLVAFPGRDLFKLEMRMAVPAWRAYGLRNLLRMAWRAPRAATGKREAEKDEFYVSHLATHPDFRRCGAGRALLGLADQLARCAGFNRVSLCVEIENEPAVALYLSHGYRIIQTVRTPHLRDWPGTPGYYRMLKAV